MTYNISYEDDALSATNISSGLDGISNLQKDKPINYKDVYYFEKVNAKSKIDSSCDGLTCVVNCSCQSGWNDTVGTRTAQKEFITLKSKINRGLSCTKAVGCDDYGYSYTSCPDGYNCGTAQKPYGTLVCYAKQEAKTCADYGYVASCPSGQTGTAHSVKLGSTTSTCYSDCEDEEEECDEGRDYFASEERAREVLFADGRIGTRGSDYFSIVEEDGCYTWACKEDHKYCSSKDTYHLYYDGTYCCLSEAPSGGGDDGGKGIYFSNVQFEDDNNVACFNGSYHATIDYSGDVPDSPITCTIYISIGTEYWEPDSGCDFGDVGTYFTDTTYTIRDCTIDTNSGTCESSSGCKINNNYNRFCGYNLSEVNDIRTSITCKNANGISITSRYPEP